MKRLVKKYILFANLEVNNNIKLYTPVETLRWRENKLEMIDQRILPLAFEYISFHSAAEIAEGIRNMVVRGAPAIGCAAASGIALEAIRLRNAIPIDFNTGMEKAFKVLAASRPTATNLFWALKRMHSKLDELKSYNISEIVERLIEEAKNIIVDDIRINRKIGKFGATLLEDGSRVLTHCNAGALATAGYGTALGVIRSAVESGKKISVIVDETRPFLQGARLTAWEMLQEKIPVTLITDNMAGFMMDKGEIDAVIVGADCVAANSDVANKIGTYMVAVLAHRHNIPLYVACPLSTIDLNIPNGLSIPIEERAAEEVLGFNNIHWAAKGVNVRNPVFDITPAALISGLITEKGIINQPNKEKLLEFYHS